ncbi:hypothetical protein BpHYR1_035777, partial [Brachionus plicatilis]
KYLTSFINIVNIIHAVINGNGIGGEKFNGENLYRIDFLSELVQLTSEVTEDGLTLIEKCRIVSERDTEHVVGDRPQPR